jgi:uncharacterized membrane protein YkvA (DUF1232 family)
VNLWQLTLGVVAGLLLIWAAMVVGLYVMARREDDPTRLHDTLRLVPDVLRLLRKLAADPSISRRVRYRLGALVIYLLLPIDVVPDFIPIAGYADDAVVAALGLRWVVQAAGVEAIERHWTGNERGLMLVKHLAGVKSEG